VLHGYVQHGGDIPEKGGLFGRPNMTIITQRFSAVKSFLCHNSQILLFEQEKLMHFV
jgi:hypothetical protein